jgi:hypothetical protein
MKTFISIVVSCLLLGVVFVFVRRADSAPVAEPMPFYEIVSFYETEQYLNWATSVDYSDYDWVETRATGTSMIQYGFADGQDIRLWYMKDCQVGDFCVFKCTVDRCVHSGVSKFLKRLVKRNGNCYWFEGNPKDWVEGGALMSSWDSRRYSWLCGKELDVTGVVKAI